MKSWPQNRGHIDNKKVDYSRACVRMSDLTPACASLCHSPEGIEQPGARQQVDGLVDPARRGGVELLAVVAN